MLPSFGGETLKLIYQRFPLIYRFKVVWMDEFVFKPRKSCRVKGLHDPVDHPPDPGGYGCYPDDKTNKYRTDAANRRQRDNLCTGNAGIGREYPHTIVVGKHPVVGARDMGSITQTLRGNPRRPALQDICRRGLCAFVSGASGLKRILLNVIQFTFAKDAGA
jgi:hypothetical protein